MNGLKIGFKKRFVVNKMPVVQDHINQILDQKMSVIQERFAPVFEDQKMSVPDHKMPVKGHRAIKTLLMNIVNDVKDHKKPVKDLTKPAVQDRELSTVKTDKVSKKKPIARLVKFLKHKEVS